jgi:hypothetical protein
MRSGPARSPSITAEKAIAQHAILDLETAEYGHLIRRVWVVGEET